MYMTLLRHSRGGQRTDFVRLVCRSKPLTLARVIHQSAFGHGFAIWYLGNPYVMKTKYST